MAGLFFKGLAFQIFGLFKNMVLEGNLCPNEYALVTVISCIPVVLLVGSLAMASNFMGTFKVWLSVSFVCEECTCLHVLDVFGCGRCSEALAV
ncbi:hypothetical protein LguiA_007510 [Lonicera macranthoides]